MAKPPDYRGWNRLLYVCIKQHGVSQFETRHHTLNLASCHIEVPITSC